MMKTANLPIAFCRRVTTLSLVILLVVVLIGLCQTTQGFPTTTIKRCVTSSNTSTSRYAKKTARAQHGGDAATSSRQKCIAALQEWAQQIAQIQVNPLLKLRQTASSEAGLGWFASRTHNDSSNPPLLWVPSKVALTVECPGSGPDDSDVAALLKGKKLSDFPWYVQMSVYLFKLDRVNDTKKGSDVPYRPWLDSLPRQFFTPLHWSSSSGGSDVDSRGHDDDDEDAALAALLQYDFMVDSVRRQRQTWKRYYDQLNNNGMVSWEDFVWGCECSRSRAFSGTYTGGAFNPSVYAFTLLLVTLYVGAGLGTLEQAANGAALVICFSILKDFVVPKLFKKKRYIICPMIDMANHKSVGTAAEVAFEFFGDAYSLSLAQSVEAGEELFISYGKRSNDQLLQYYGFVEVDNPHDVYVLPPLRNWDIGALEKACGRQFARGRLEKLDRAGLLGNGAASTSREIDVTEDEAANVGGGVVLTRTDGIDPAVLQALRALVSSEEEWQAAGQAIGSFIEEKSGGIDNERCALDVAQTAIQMELASKATTIAEDDLFLRRASMGGLVASPEEKLAVRFRIEKKKILFETIEKLKKAKEALV